MRSTPLKVLILAGSLVGTATAADTRPDLLVADFEATTYGPGWQVEGSAFGAGPARGTLAGQMSVTGFAGERLVNSFGRGDDAEGSLTSPPFRIDRRYLNLLVGGGKYPGQTCVDLIIDGKPVRTATGPNDRPGGSERLDWATWDVGDLAGQTAVLRVVDARKGGWGHICLDQVVQADTRKQAEPKARSIVASARYLHLPVGTKAPLRRVQIRQGDRVVRDFDIRLADNPGDFTTWLDLTPFRGATLTITTELPADSTMLDGLSLRDELPSPKEIYAEADRPQFHFTSRRGWLNDPNGLVWHEGKYHLFYQHNPYGWDWGNMHWGHATSPDLIHWAEQPIALYPRQYGDWCFSGSAVVDTANRSGWGQDGKQPLVAAYTSTGRGECIIFSDDQGHTWTEFAGNPVVKHDGRDPRLVWHEPTQRWIMAVYDETARREAIVFHSSPNLKDWTEESRIDGFFECPDLYELPVVGSSPSRSLWVLSAADGKYRLGQFDGHKFTPETEKLTLWHGDFYAAQTFSNTPDGRRIQIGWGRNINFPGMPFNQQMTIPCQLTLRTTTAGPRLFAEPVAEVAQLRGASRTWTRSGAGRDDDDLGAALPRIETAAGIDLTITARGEAEGGWTATLYGASVSYDPAQRVVSVAGLAVPLAPAGDQVSVRILADRRSLEVFGNAGQVAASRHFTPLPGAPALEVTLPGAADRPQSIQIEDHTLKSAW